MRQNLNENFAIITYTFFSSLLSGLVLVGIGSSFSLMLSENGIDVSSIAHMLLATIPYSWKFAISPFIKNLILRYKSPKFDVIKLISYTAQAVIFFGFASLGFWNDKKDLLLCAFIIFFIVLAVSIHDILRAHTKLVFFQDKDFGFVSAIENTGFRLGMFISGACIVYIANSIGWRVAFMVPAFAVWLATIATFFAKFGQEYSCEKTCTEKPRNFLKNYLKIGYNFFKTYGIITLFCIIISFKVTDSTINGLKPMFIHFLGINRIAFANMVHLYGLLTMTVAGIVAGFALGKLRLSTCIRCTFFAQTIVSLIFIYLVTYHNNLLTVTLLVNIATFVFGFCGVVFRTFIAHISKRDVNIYTIFLSLGSLIRICTYSFAGFVVEHYSWNILFTLCLISNIPGYILIAHFLKKALSQDKMPNRKI